MSGCQSAESLFGKQHHDVDVGTRVQFAAAIAADGDQPQVAGKFAGVTEPRRAQRDIHQTRAVAHQIFDRLIGDEAIFEQFAALIEDLAKDDGGELALFEGCGDCREVGPVGDLI